jgi:hypothetical protein
MVSFKIYPDQNNQNKFIHTKAKLKGNKLVRSSSGHGTLRPVIMTKIQIGEKVHSIEMTLVNRKIMGFRMLLGRSALSGHYLIDPSHSYRQNK